jgi:allantoin racemase
VTTRRIAVLGSGVRWNDGRPPAYLAAAAEPGVDLVGVGLRAPVFPYTPAEHVLVEMLLLDAGIRALEQDADAVFIDTFGEYAIEAIRAVTDVPVIGAAEAAIAEARAAGPRFAIVTVWPDSMQWIYDLRLTLLGAREECTGVTYVSSRGGRASGTAVADRVREEVAAGAAGLRADVVAACREAAAGADSIVLGCTCMGPIHEELAAAVPVPVICASRAGLRAATAAAARSAGGGARTPRSPDPRFVARVRAASAALAVAGVHSSAADARESPAPPDEDCPVCVVSTGNPSE